MTQWDGAATAKSVERGESVEGSRRGRRSEARGQRREQGKPSGQSPR
ncbi:hypothetical protein GS506_05315 [Rhodococcus hoagii]|nr:hypothetical protein [Prescottella equi]